MTTTERPPTRARLGLGDTRLYAVALIATLDALAWWGFAMRTPPPPAELAGPDPEPAAGSRVVAWYDDLPPSTRPLVSLPAGWRVVPGTSASSPYPVEAPTVVRVRPSPGRRIRTRSS